MGIFVGVAALLGGVLGGTAGGAAAMRIMGKKETPSSNSNEEVMGVVRDVAFDTQCHIDAMEAHVVQTVQECAIAIHAKADERNAAVLDMIKKAAEDASAAEAKRAEDHKTILAMMEAINKKISTGEETRQYLMGAIARMDAFIDTCQVSSSDSEPDPFLGEEAEKVEEVEKAPVTRRRNKKEEA